MFSPLQFLKTFFLALLFLSAFNTSFAQKRAHVLYAELGGNALFYSANYDVRFAKSDKGLGLRLGVSPTTDGVITPVQINYVTGGRHKLEIGAGIFTGYDNEVPWGVIPNAALMYRFQGTKGFNFRIGWTPTFLPEKDRENSWLTSNTYLSWGGVSFGYRF